MALKHWVWLTTRPGVGAKTAGELLKRFESPEQIFFAGESELRAAGMDAGRGLSSLLDKSMDEPRRVLDVCADRGFRVITRNDAEYPERLLNIYDPPVALFVAGRLPTMDEEAAIAVVGTRKCTPYGIKTAERMGYEITRAGGLVVSGLARGIDSAAARGALRAGGAVVGVLGTAIDVVYPPENRSLFRDVASTGAIISEYAPGTASSRGAFPARNRIMSGVSVGVVVIEAPADSGALITAARALEQGRDVFAVPGNVDAPACAGSNALLREGAILAANGWDVTSEYAARFPEKLGRASARENVPINAGEAEKLVKNELEHCESAAALSKKEIDNANRVDYIDLVIERSSLSADEENIISALSAPDMQVDDIIEASGLSARSALSALTLLQIKGAVEQKNGKRFTLTAKIK